MVMPLETLSEVPSDCEGPCHGLHAVYFYESDDRLCEMIAGFVASGFAAGESAVVIATAAHCHALRDLLAARQIDVGAALVADQLQLLDADETLAALMIGSTPDRSRFERAVRPFIQRAAAAGPSGRVRAYGEMVDLLWAQGNRSAAFRLEELWTDLQAVEPFSLLCAYALAGFFKQTAGQPDELARVSASHRDVHLPEGAAPAPWLTAELRSRELAQRQQVEWGLRESLRELREKNLRAERLTQIVAAIARAVTPEQVFEALVDEVAEALGAATAGLWLVGEDGASARLTRARGYPDAANQLLGEIALGEPARFPVADAMTHLTPVWIESRAAMLRQYPALIPVTTPDIEYSVACLPIGAPETVRGALALTFDDGRPLDETERGFLRLVARYGEQALERLRLLRLDEQSRLRAELLYGLAGAVIRAERVEQIFDAALDAIERALGTTGAAIRLCDAAAAMRFAAWRNLSDEHRRAVDGRSPWSCETHDPEPIFSADVAADTSLAPHHELFRHEGIGALGLIPLIASGHLVGELMVCYDRPRALAPPERDLARAIADHVAAAVARFRSLAELQETVRLNEIFTGILGHDLRNPLTAILTTARTAMARDQQGHLLKPLSRILWSGDRMTRMIDQLLDFTRVRLAGGIPLLREAVDLVAVVRQVMDELDDAHPDRALRLTHTGDTAGCFDPDRLSQVFSNLVANALQHGGSGGTVEVDVDGRRGDEIAVSVHNRGAIPPDVLPTLFEPLAGGTRRLDRSRGLGLGLYITRELVRAHGGHTEVASSDAHGTTFTVTLPRDAG
jgi:signal transduction histidine kinase